MRKSPFQSPPPDKTASLAEREAYWQAHLERWRASGESQSAYSRRHGLRANQLSYWHCREQRLNDEARTPPLSAPSASGGFVPVQVVAPAEPEALAVRLPNGVVIEGITPANLSVVGSLIAQL